MSGGMEFLNIGPSQDLVILFSNLLYSYSTLLYEHSAIFIHAAEQLATSKAISALMRNFSTSLLPPEDRSRPRLVPRLLFLRLLVLFLLVFLGIILVLRFVNPIFY